MSKSSIPKLQSKEKIQIVDPPPPAVTETDEYSNQDEEEEEPLTLLSLLEETDIDILEHLFQRYPKQHMNKSTLRMWMTEFLKGKPRGNECLKMVFYKLSADGKKKIGWGDFLRYMLLEFRPTLRSTDMYLPAVEKPIRCRGKNHRGTHKMPIINIIFHAAIKRNERKIDYSRGKYFTISSDGLILKWNIDFEMEKKLRVPSPTLKVARTMITDITSLADLNMVCISCTERELRFYETVAGGFSLRAVISEINHAVECLHYQMFDNLCRPGILLAGDVKGNIKMFELNPQGPFQAIFSVVTQGDSEYILISYSELWTGRIEGIQIREATEVHSPHWVSKLGFDVSLNWIISCSEMAVNGSLVMTDYNSLEPMYVITLDHGVNCFLIFPGHSRLVTGSKDYLVRLWHTGSNVRPMTTYKGHQSSIRYLFTQYNGKLLYSLDASRTLKVWDTEKGWAIQTVCEQLNDVGDGLINALYNPWARVLYVANMKVMSITVGYDIDPNYTDGYTHSLAVTKILVHPQMQAMVTMGMDSCILIWNPLTGKQLGSIWHAHSKNQDGEYSPVGITAATFNPTYMYLLTGAVDGTIKMWDFFTLTCVRSMLFAKHNVVTSLIWVPQRILAAGWTRCITEWEDSRDVGPSKIWPKNHCDSINHAALLWPIGVVTSSEVGELIFNRISTGQPYKRNLVSRPNDVFMSNITAEDFERRRSKSPYLISGKRKSDMLRPSIKAGVKRASVIEMPVKGLNAERIAVKCLLRLKSRPMDPKVGSLLVSLQTGYVQLWSHHPVGGFLDTMYAIHSPADYVSVMATTVKNKYLFTGHADGYVKVWLLTNWGSPGPHKIICWPKLRLRFPFLIKDRIKRRAERAVRYQEEPPLLSSFRAHVSGITDLALLEENKVFGTASYDKSVRIWTYGGQYVGTLGSFHRWYPLPIDKRAYVENITMPPDVRKVASSTTLKVMTDGFRHLRTKGIKTVEEVKFEKLIESKRLKEPIYGSHPSEPILGEFYSSGVKTKSTDLAPQVDLSNPAGIRIFSNYELYAVETIDLPEGPTGFNKEAPICKIMRYCGLKGAPGDDTRDSDFEEYEEDEIVEEPLGPLESSTSEDMGEEEEEAAEEAEQIDESLEEMEEGEELGEEASEQTVATLDSATALPEEFTEENESEEDTNTAAAPGD